MPAPKSRASADKSLDKTLRLAKRRLSPIDVQLGPVPVVIEPEVEANLHLTGKLGATFSALAEANAGASVTFDSKTGFRPQHSFSGNASATVNKQIDAHVKASFDPTIKADLYGLGSSYVSVGISPYVEATADACTVRAYAGIDAHLGFSLGINHALSVSKDFSFPAIRKTLLAEPWRNCAVWAGTMTAKFLGHYLDDQGNKVADEKSTATITLKPPPNGQPPDDGIYAFTGSGSGVVIAREFGCQGEPNALFDTYRKAWGDEMRKINGEGFSFSPGATGTTAVHGCRRPLLPGENDQHLVRLPHRIVGDEHGRGAIASAVRDHLGHPLRPDDAGRQDEFQRNPDTTRHTRRQRQHRDPHLHLDIDQAVHPRRNPLLTPPAADQMVRPYRSSI